jgi:hypothetical protein
MRGSLGEMEVQQACAGQIEAHKKKLIARKSLAKGGSLLASDALQTMAKKRKKEADEALRKANAAYTRARNKQLEELWKEGVADCQKERERKELIQQHQTLGITIPPLAWIPIRDHQKEATTAENEARCIALQSLYEAVGTAQHDRDEVYAANPTSFTSIPIDPAILEEERQFQISQRGGLQVIIPVESEEEDGGFESEGVESGGVESGVDSALEDYRSVMSIDSIAENADFVSLE